MVFANIWRRVGDYSKIAPKLSISHNRFEDNQLGTSTGYNGSLFRISDILSNFLAPPRIPTRSEEGMFYVPRTSTLLPFLCEFMLSKEWEWEIVIHQFKKENRSMFLHRLFPVGSRLSTNFAFQNKLVCGRNLIDRLAHIDLRKTEQKYPMTCSRGWTKSGSKTSPSAINTYIRYIVIYNPSISNFRFFTRCTTPTGRLTREIQWHKVSFIS